KSGPAPTSWGRASFFVFRERGAHVAGQAGSDTRAGQGRLSGGRVRVLAVVLLAVAGLAALHQGAELEGQQAVGGRVATQEGQERVGADQDGFRLAVDGQNATGIGVFQGLEDFWQVAVKLSATNKTNAGLGHD